MSVHTDAIGLGLVLIGVEVIVSRRGLQPGRDAELDSKLIKSLDNTGLSHQFLDFFEHHKNDPEYNKATIDEYFIKKICKGECRHR